MRNQVNDSALSLFGESQEEDRRHIAELVLFRMQQLFANVPVQEDKPPGIWRGAGQFSSKPASVTASPTAEEKNFVSAPPPLTAQQLKEREELFGLTNSGASERATAAGAQHSVGDTFP
jgi:hypothetical protein